MIRPEFASLGDKRLAGIFSQMISGAYYPHGPNEGTHPFGEKSGITSAFVNYLRPGGVGFEGSNALVYTAPSYTTPQDVLRLYEQAAGGLVDLADKRGEDENQQKMREAYMRVVLESGHVVLAGHVTAYYPETHEQVSSLYFHTKATQSLFFSLRDAFLAEKQEHGDDRLLEISPEAPVWAKQQITLAPESSILPTLAVVSFLPSVAMFRYHAENIYGKK